jgi:hypothetical protein
MQWHASPPREQTASGLSFIDETGLKRETPCWRAGRSLGESLERISQKSRKVKLAREQSPIGGPFPPFRPWSGFQHRPTLQTPVRSAVGCAEAHLSG